MVSRGFTSAITSVIASAAGVTASGACVFSAAVSSFCSAAGSAAGASGAVTPHATIESPIASAIKTDTTLFFICVTSRFLENQLKKWHCLFDNAIICYCGRQ